MTSRIGMKMSQPQFGIFLFVWSAGYPSTGRQYKTGLELKENLFDSIDKKIAYLQGVFEDDDEGWGIIRGESWIHFANSYDKVKRCKRWINEIAREKLLQETWGHGVISHYIKYDTYPIVHKVEIHPKVVESIKAYG